MIIKQNGSVLEKYEVVFNREKLIELKEEINRKFCKVSHFSYTSSLLPMRDPKTMKNFKYNKIGWREYDCATEMEYEISYDKFEMPKLSAYIDKLLDGNDDALESIYDKTIDEKTDNYDKRIDVLSKELDEIDNLDIKNKKIKLIELERLINERDRFNNDEMIESYYYKVRELISFRLVETICIEEVNKVNNFFGDDSYVKKLKRRIKNVF